MCGCGAHVDIPQTKWYIKKNWGLISLARESGNICKSLIQNCRITTFNSE